MLLGSSVASTKDDSAICSSLAQENPLLLNTGVQAAHGEVLAFIDDDVTVEPQWLNNLTEPLRVGKWAGAGGRVLLSGHVHALHGPRLRGRTRAWHILS